MLRGKSSTLPITLTNDETNLTHVMIFCARNTHTSSRNYTGKGTAAYPNGDSYTGDFLDGVSTLKLVHSFSND